MVTYNTSYLYKIIIIKQLCVADVSVIVVCEGDILPSLKDALDMF